MIDAVITDLELQIETPQSEFGHYVSFRFIDTTPTFPKLKNMIREVVERDDVSLVDDAANGLGNYNEEFLSLWKWDDHVNDYKTLFFEDTDTTKVEESYIIKTIAEAPQISKVFDNCRIIMIGTNQTINDSTIDFDTEITDQQTI